MAKAGPQTGDWDLVRKTGTRQGQNTPRPCLGNPVPIARPHLLNFLELFKITLSAGADIFKAWVHGGVISNLNYNTVSKPMFRNEADVSESHIMGLAQSEVSVTVLACWVLWPAEQLLLTLKDTERWLCCSAAVFQQGSQLIFKRRMKRRPATSVWESWLLSHWFCNRSLWIHFHRNPCQHVSEDDAVFFYFVPSFHNKIAWIKWTTRSRRT